MTLSEAVTAFIGDRMAQRVPGEPMIAPDDPQVWGTIGSLMGLTKAERQQRRQEMLEAFAPAWIAAGGVPRAVDPKKARVARRKTNVKQIKSRRAEIAKIAAANQKNPIAPLPPKPAP